MQIQEARQKQKNRRRFEHPTRRQAIRSTKRKESQTLNATKSKRRLIGVRESRSTLSHYVDENGINFIKKIDSLASLYLGQEIEYPDDLELYEIQAYILDTLRLNTGLDWYINGSDSDDFTLGYGKIVYPKVNNRKCYGFETSSIFKEENKDFQYILYAASYFIAKLGFSDFDEQSISEHEAMLFDFDDDIAFYKSLSRAFDKGLIEEDTFDELVGDSEFSFLSYYYENYWKCPTLRRYLKMRSEIPFSIDRVKSIYSSIDNYSYRRTFKSVSIAAMAEIIIENADLDVDVNQYQVSHYQENGTWKLSSDYGLYDKHVSDFVSRQESESRQELFEGQYIVGAEIYIDANDNLGIRKTPSEENFHKAFSILSELSNINHELNRI